jgi:hypothetical protein
MKPKNSAHRRHDLWVRPAIGGALLATPGSNQRAQRNRGGRSRVFCDRRPSWEPLAAQNENVAYQIKKLRREAKLS